MAGSVIKTGAGIVAGVVAYFLVQAYFDQTPADSSGASLAEVEQMILQPPADAIYGTIKLGFPEAYAAHLAALRAIATDPALSQAQANQLAFEESRDFTQNLRLDNARYLDTAPRAALVEMQHATLRLLETLQDDKALCTRVAAQGLTGFGLDDVSRLDMDIVTQAAAASFAAIAAGRDTPQVRDRSSDADWDAFKARWLATGETTQAEMNAFLEGRTGDVAAYCDAAIGFQTQLISDPSEGATRILADVMRTMAAN